MVWEILKDAGIDPAPERTSDSWAAFLRSQAEAILAADFFEAVTLTGARLHILAVIEHASRRVRILGATANPTAGWMTQAARKSGDGPAGRRLPRPLPHPRSGRQVPGLVRHDPRRGWHRGRAQRGPDAPHERDHGALDPKLPPRAARPHVGVEPGAPAARPPRVRAALQRPPTPPGHLQHPSPTPAPRSDHRSERPRPTQHPAT